MASAARGGNNGRMTTAGNSFRERGGWWVVAQALLLLGIAAVPLWNAALTAPDWLAPLPGAGVLLLVFGVAVSLWSAVALGRALTPYPRPRDNGEFSERGPYRLARHPIYTGVWVAALGWVLIWQSTAGGGLAIALGVLLDRKAAREERWLARRYPDYEAYRRRVRKFLPWIY